MTSAHEAFWTHSSFALIGHTAKKGFPRISYRELKKRGKKIFAVDPSLDEIDGDKTYPDLRALPEKVDAVVVEVPREEVGEQAPRAVLRNRWERGKISKRSCASRRCSHRVRSSSRRR